MPKKNDELAAFREKVSTIAPKIVNEGYWTTEQMNEVLLKLGLPPRSKFVAVVTATGTNTTQVQLNSGTAEGAEMEAKNVIESPIGCLAGYLWTADTGSAKVEIKDISRDLTVEADPDASTTDLAVYRKLVRRTALAEAKERGWCDSGVSRYLEELGLPPKSEVYVPVRVTTTTVSRVRIDDAEDYDDAVAMVESGKADESISRYLGSDIEKASLVDLDELKVGDGDATNAYGSNLCNNRSDEGGWRCTRDPHTSGQHIAGSGTRVRAVWPYEKGTPRRF